MEEILGTDLKDVLNSEGSVIVDFYAPWCSPCKMLAPMLEQLSKENEEVKVVKINIDVSMETAFELGIKNVPTVIKFKNGEIVGKQVGIAPMDVYKKMFDDEQLL